MKRFLFVAAALALLAAPLSAHHSTAMYEMANPTTIKGTVKRFEWTNPHAFIYLDVKTRLSNSSGHAPPSGFRRNVVEVQQNTTFPGGSRQSGSYPETGFWEAARHFQPSAKVSPHGATPLDPFHLPLSRSV